jgi:hypothetical protein
MKRLVLNATRTKKRFFLPFLKINFKTPALRDFNAGVLCFNYWNGSLGSWNGSHGRLAVESRKLPKIPALIRNNGTPIV